MSHVCVTGITHCYSFDVGCHMFVSLGLPTVIVLMWGVTCLCHGVTHCYSFDVGCHMFVSLGLPTVIVLV